MSFMFKQIRWEESIISSVFAKQNIFWSGFRWKFFTSVEFVLFILTLLLNWLKHYHLHGYIIGFDKFVRCYNQIPRGTNAGWKELVRIEIKIWKTCIIVHGSKFPSHGKWYFLWNRARASIGKWSYCHLFINSAGCCYISVLIQSSIFVLLSSFLSMVILNYFFCSVYILEVKVN